MATIYEVSKLAGVSLATVSRAMNDRSRVSEKTLAKVMAAMEQLNYRPNSIAQSLAANRSNSVGVLVSEIHGPIFGAMLSGIDAELRASGKFTLFATGHSDREKEREGIRFLTSRNCDALILHIEALTDEYLLEHRDESTPFVVINREIAGMENKCVSLDNELGGYEATRYLLQLGHRDIAYISGPMSWGDAAARWAGHKRALESFGVQFDAGLMVEGDYHERGGAKGTTRLLENGQPFTAIVCANDEMAAGAMDAIRAKGLSIPDDISVVGFDNAPLSRYLYPKLTTIDHPATNMGRMAAKWVLHNVYGIEADIQRMFAPTLIERASTAPPSK
ncbi:MAG: LacI family DNA-binding transcriptional regulator [Pseudomonadota bacterium]